MRAKQYALSDREASDILKLYGIKVASASALVLGMDNINMRVVGEDEKAYVLKVSPASCDDVLRQVAVIRRAGRRCQQPLQMATGAEVFSYADRSGYVLPYIDGDDFLDKEIDPREIREIARFHRETARALSNLDVCPRPNIWNLSRFYREQGRFTGFLDLECELPELRFTNDPVVVVHNDFTRSNLLRRGGGELHLLDYGDVSAGHEIADLAVALAHFCVEGTPDEDILPQIGDFLEARGSAPDLSDLYHLIALRFVQARCLAAYENETLGAHPRAAYWLSFGSENYRRFSRIRKDLFVDYLSVQLDL